MFAIPAKSSTSHNSIRCRSRNGGLIVTRSPAATVHRESDLCVGGLRPTTQFALAVYNSPPLRSTMAGIISYGLICVRSVPAGRRFKRRPHSSKESNPQTCRYRRRPRYGAGDQSQVRQGHRLEERPAEAARYRADEVISE
jgi:hypothetical protein